MLRDETASKVMNSIGFIFGVFAGILILFYVIGRLMDAQRSGMLEQFEIMRKRFGFELRRFGSKWGWGIGEHYALEGRYRGYSVHVYEHFHASDKEKQHWTSITFELLFTGGLELLVETPGTQERARFEHLHSVQKTDAALGNDLSVTVYLNDPKWKALDLEEAQLERMKRFFGNASMGSIRLSKGFIEYREAGALRENEMRIRFQDAILVLADISDALSAHPNKDDWETLFEDETLF